MLFVSGAASSYGYKHASYYIISSCFNLSLVQLFKLQTLKIIFRANIILVHLICSAPVLTTPWFLVRVIKCVFNKNLWFAMSLFQSCPVLWPYTVASQCYGQEAVVSRAATGSWLYSAVDFYFLRWLKPPKLCKQLLLCCCRPSLYKS